MVGGTFIFNSNTSAFYTGNSLLAWDVVFDNHYKGHYSIHKGVDDKGNR
jgi:hypothetical protein